MTAEKPRNGRAAFRIRDFRLYVSSRFFLTLASQIMNVAIAWFVYEQTKDPLALGLIGLATFLPAIPLSFVTGAVADRYDRRMILIVSCVVLALCAAAVFFLTGLSVVWPMYVVVVVLGSARSFANPAGQALMMSIVPDEEYTSAVSWNNSITQVANIAGPGIGGLLYPLGVGVPFAVAFVLFVLSCMLAVAMETRAKKGVRPPVTLAMVVAGYQYIWSKPVLLGSITLDLVAVLLGGATALLPIFAQDIFLAGPWALGLLRSTPSVGSVIAALVFANYAPRRNIGKIMLACVFIYGLATVGFGLSTNIFVAMVFLAITGAADMISVVIRQTLIQVETPNEMRGRVIAVHTILTGTSNQLGEFRAGTHAYFVGAVGAVVFGGVAAMAATLWWARKFPELRDRDRFEVPAPSRKESV
jgi:MFS family permease